MTQNLTGPDSPGRIKRENKTGRIKTEKKNQTEERPVPACTAADGPLFVLISVIGNWQTISLENADFPVRC